MRRRRGLVILRQVRLAAVAVVCWAVGHLEVFSELELHVTSSLLVEELGVNREVFLAVVLIVQRARGAPILLLDLVGEVLVAPDAEVLVVPVLMVYRGGQGARGHRGEGAGLLLGAPGGHHGVPLPLEQHIALVPGLVLVTPTVPGQVPMGAPVRHVIEAGSAPLSPGLGPLGTDHSLLGPVQRVAGDGLGVILVLLHLSAGVAGHGHVVSPLGLERGQGGRHGVLPSLQQVLT